MTTSFSQLQVVTLKSTKSLVGYEYKMKQISNYLMLQKAFGITAASCLRF